MAPMGTMQAEEEELDILVAEVYSNMDTVYTVRVLMLLHTGGGSGIDGAGGGGGSSYFDPSMNAEADSLFAAGAMDTSATLVGMPLVLNKTDISACLSWYFDVTKSSSWGSILQYDIEYAEGPSSEDFLSFGVVPATAINSASNLISANFTAKGLSPFTTYRFRIVPVFQRGASRASPPVLVTTFASPENYWEALFPRRYSRANTGYGYSDPVLSRPHVDFPSNFTSLASKADEMTDGPTSSVPLLPSGRRGHSLTMLGDGTVYMFGGRTVGEPCSLTYTDYTNRETLYSPPIYEVNPCETSFGDVNEVWRVDIRTYEWELLKVNTSLPSAREQHASTALQDSIFIFGGKYTNTSAIGSGDSEEVILGDLWRLSVPYNTTILVINNATEAIPDTARLFSPANTSLYGAPDDDLRSGQCVQSVVVRVTFTHPCASQIRISLMGPGPPSGSQDFHSPSSALEEVLFNRCTTGGRMQCAQGLQNITFTDTSLRSFLECCPQVYQGDYHPEGHISTFIGSDPFGNWSLIVEDMVQDDLTGTLLHWELELVVAPCVPTYSWTEVSSLNVVPAPRYQARMITINSSFFLFGGQGISGEELTDLWRFDLDTLQWTSLATSNQPSSMFDFAYGASIMLSPLGILEFGGYSPSERSVEHPTDLYSNKLLVVDLSTKARQLPKVSSPVQPQPRYLAAAVYIPSSAISWRHSFSTAAIYNQSLPSTRSNFVGQMIESVFVFGGDVGISGMTADGSGGGALSDSWMLRLATFSTDDSRTSRRLNRDRSCAWRLQSQSAADAFGVSGCYGSFNSTPCNLVALFISAWCLGAFQTI